MWEFWLLGIALAVDCFSVSVAEGIADGRRLRRGMVAMALSFGVFQGGMTLAGYLAMSLFSGYIAEFDHWIAFGLLLYLGVRMIVEDNGDGAGEGNRGATAAMGRTLMLSVATSIDALAVGISIACSGGRTDMTAPVLIIAFCSTALSLLGFGIGIRLGGMRRMHAGRLGGIVLIGIGVKILLEHLL